MIEKCETCGSREGTLERVVGIPPFTMTAVLCPVCVRSFEEQEGVDDLLERYTRAKAKTAWCLSRREWDDDTVLAYDAAMTSGLEAARDLRDIARAWLEENLDAD